MEKHKWQQVGWAESVSLSRPAVSLGSWLPFGIFKPVVTGESFAYNFHTSSVTVSLPLHPGNISDFRIHTISLDPPDNS